ncbi:PREDICTED: uncharacterized protein LOC107357781 isoform X3 [Acropora digitifera]|uniref:uncharacterized protein LOC107357781 isoform X3 n=1 Tax=Acropora digitifera TaxID=70779 RepID=UPI00077A37F0|nr:PREDICTED: uncharacterized protein LOC107357781 isoform X3 [Acropora digitifera]
MTDALVQTYGKHQKQAWIKVATAVNAVNPAERKTVEQIKKKWEDITGHVKKKERQARRQELKKINTTGNGFLADEDDPDSVATCSEILNQSEQEVARILGPEILSGIPGGQDSMILDNTALPKPVSEQDLNQGSNNSPCDDICDVLQVFSFIMFLFLHNIVAYENIFTSFYYLIFRPRRIISKLNWARKEQRLFQKLSWM